MNNNGWDSSSEDEYENENEKRNNDPLPEMDSEFRKKVMNIKHSLYKASILSPELGTVQAQNNGILQDYLNKINVIYVLSLRAQNGKKIMEKELMIFPEEVREELRVVLEWIDSFFRNNHIAETIPYSDYLRKSFHDYQFVQNNSFEEQ
jgi:hypothetical protein